MLGTAPGAPFALRLDLDALSVFLGADLEGFTSDGEARIGGSGIRNSAPSPRSATGEELARIEIPELGAFQRVFALAVRGSTPWLLTDGDFTGMSVVRLDPLTGSLHESFTIPGVFVAIDAEFGTDGRLFVSDKEWNPIGTGWCTDHWTVPFLGASPELRFTHCWEEPDPPPPDLAYFTLGAPPLVEIPTLNATAVAVLVALLALAGVLAVRRRTGDVSAR